ncbi:TPA: hypothetical protein ACN7F6_005208 [Klebsiella pneumoniae]|uniref:HEPN/RES N-terminal domain-containing protein n=1 Tax=Klebsiella pneumoniae CG43 TaxID=1244085 RepID=Q6U5L3_KLEPN|nr:hypothetical protein [Klebsiella pneumoniae]AAR07858.1 hypothetical protein LV005 [Klebsiella pneumoniae CG43]EWD05218.1 hypothetical protein P845_05080 [Klebsiella pneumoniae UCI 42]SSJ54460.1 Uncharacterised protein [Klebsiella pneumoniae]SWS26662.1 Uncharacterised protein [Klebsiella pneumoniae]VGC05725.1 Uncharacterised protein [Klebsiella pneumoniae]
MPGSKRICRQCLNDDRYLNNIIASDPDASESCDYCDSDEMTMSMETLAEKVDWLIENYYRGGEYNHYLEEYEGEPFFSVLEQEVTANDNIIDDLSELLEELWFDWSSHDRKYGDEPHFVEAVTISGNLSRKWNSMEGNLERVIDSLIWTRWQLSKRFLLTFTKIIPQHSSILSLTNQFSVVVFFSQRMHLKSHYVCPSRVSDLLLLS